MQSKTDLTARYSDLPGMTTEALSTDREICIPAPVQRLKQGSMSPQLVTLGGGFIRTDSERL